MTRFHPPDVARRQGGAFTAAQAIAAGLTRRQVRYRLDTGRWHPVAGHALSATPRPEPGWPATTLAWAARLTWPDGIVGGFVAGRLHGFPVELSTWVLVFVGAKHDPQPGLVARRFLPPASQVERRPDGLIITSAVRTALDCLAGAPSQQAASDLYAWLSTRRVIGPGHLEAAVRHGTGRHGIGTLRRLVHLARDGAVSEAEARMHALLRAAGIDGWAAGVQVSDRHGLIGVVDLLFAHERVVIEIDGRRAHTDADSFERDRARQNRLVRAGYLVLRYTWRRLHDHPDDVIAEIRAVLAAR
jgi:very-short-patch-repair endonuclease